MSGPRRLLITSTVFLLPLAWAAGPRVAAQARQPTDMPWRTLEAARLPLETQIPRVGVARSRDEAELLLDSWLRSPDPRAVRSWLDAAAIDFGDEMLVGCVGLLGAGDAPLTFDWIEERCGLVIVELREASPGAPPGATVLVVPCRRMPTAFFEAGTAPDAPFHPGRTRAFVPGGFDEGQDLRVLLGLCPRVVRARVASVSDARPLGGSLAVTFVVLDAFKGGPLESFQAESGLRPPCGPDRWLRDLEAREGALWLLALDAERRPLWRELERSDRREALRAYARRD